MPTGSFRSCLPLPCPKGRRTEGFICAKGSAKGTLRKSVMLPAKLPIWERLHRHKLLLLLCGVPLAESLCDCRFWAGNVTRTVTRTASGGSRSTPFAKRCPKAYKSLTNGFAEEPNRRMGSAAQDRMTASGGNGSTPSVNRCPKAYKV